MKKLSKALLLLAAVLSSGSLMAAGLLDVNVIQGSNEKAVVSVANGGNEKCVVEVADPNGELVYYRHLKNSGNSYSEKFDFSGLADGNYTLSVKLGDETEVNSLRVKNGDVQITNQEEEIAPYFAMKGNLLEVNFLDFSKKAVKLKVYDDETDQLIYSTALNSDFTVNKAFDLSKFDHGRYDAVLENGDQVYDYEFKL